MARTAIERSDAAEDSAVSPASRRPGPAPSRAMPASGDPELHLTVELRYGHLAEEVHRHVAEGLRDEPEVDLQALAGRLELEGYPLRITRDLEEAKAFTIRHCAGIASPPDEPMIGKCSPRRGTRCAPSQFGVREQPMNFPADQAGPARMGPWFAESGGMPDDPNRGPVGIVPERLQNKCMSRHVRAVPGDSYAALARSPGASDFVRTRGRWSNQYAKRYASPGQVESPTPRTARGRVLAYRVLRHWSARHHGCRLRRRYPPLTRRTDS